MAVDHIQATDVVCKESRWKNFNAPSLRKLPDALIEEHLPSRQKEEIKNKLIVALDYPNLSETEALVRRLGDRVGFFKVGMELFFQKEGIAFAQELKEQGSKIFFDAKSFDIPRTVEAAIKSLHSLNVDFISIHSVSISLLKAMARMPRATKLVGITLLTSMGQAELRQMGIRQSTQEVVMSLAKAAMTIGKLDGLVASGQEIAILREKYPEAILIAPGIRPEGTQGQDHKRVSTPKQAIAAGADHIVVGRPITQAKDPVAVVEKIFEEVEQGLNA